MAFRLVLDAQHRGEPVAWTTTQEQSFFPPGVEQSGVDLRALAAVRVPYCEDLARAADVLARSAAFGLLVLDHHPAAWIREQTIPRHRRSASATLCPAMNLEWSAAAPRDASDPVIQAGDKTIVTNADQLPRRHYTLPRLPSELLEAPHAELDAVVDALDRDMAGDLATLDIRDRATRTAMLQARCEAALHRGEWRAAQAFLREIRAQQEKQADQLASGVLPEALAQVQLEGGTPEQQRARLRALLSAAWSAMPWAVVGDALKGEKSGLELFSRNLALGGFRASLDPAAVNLRLAVPAKTVVAVVATRNALQLLEPVRADAIAVLQGLVDANRVAKVDRWTERLVTLPATAGGTPVVVGIWDSGTDVSLFRCAAAAGIAFDQDMNPTAPLLRPLGAVQERLPELKRFVKGVMDLRAAIDSDDARALQQHLLALAPEDVKAFQEDLRAIGLWLHGTHVAGIAVEGNPFARVTVVAMHWSSAMEPRLPDEASAARTAAAYRAAVDHFQVAGARVVNMSWRYGPARHEGALAHHDAGGTPEGRKRRAHALFAIERQALEAAIRSAPEILFVAGSGNEDNSADFANYIPAGFELPNLVTAGAVDQAGTETSFSSFGKTVVVHANGFEVTSFLPGGDRARLSGTSMAAPQVANLAAKLLAMRPELTVAEVKALILAGAERNGRVNVINPRASFARSRSGA